MKYKIMNKSKVAPINAYIDNRGTYPNGKQ